jgi:hemolysin activation/secretion protein
MGAHAQIDPSALGRQSDIIQRQQQDLLRADQERARRAAPTQPGIDLRDLQPQVAVPDLGVKCRDIKVVTINGATKLPDSLRQQVNSEFAGRCLGVTELEAALALITKSYIDRGFITTRAYLPAQDLRTGTLEITVIEGTIEGYKVNGPRANAIWPPGVFPARPGDLLNLRDLEQGVDQINRLSSNRARLDIQPGDKPGQSMVLIDNPSVLPINLLAAYDNFGTPATGRDSASATVSLDSVLGLNELISLTRRESVPHDRDHNSSASALDVSVPFGASLLTFDTSDTTYANRIALPSGSTLVSSGETKTNSVLLDRVVYRSQASRISLSGRLTTQDTQSFLGGQFLGVASRRLAYADVGVSGFTALGGGIANGRFAYVKGLAGWGAMHDPDDLPDDAPRAQFRKATLDLGFNRGFAIAQQPFNWSSQFSGQYAYDTLYGSQQFLVGGVSSVRGSLLNTLSGDSGYLWRNELSLPWQSTAGGGLSGRVYVAYDFGAVTNRAAGTVSGSMSGATIGTSIAWKGLSVDVFASRALHLPSVFTRESTFYGVRVSCSL